MNEFGKRLRLLRSDKKLSQSELAKQIGISKSSINMYERGEREPSFETLEAIADYFNVDIDYLMGRETSGNEITLSVQVNEQLFSEKAQPIIFQLAGVISNAGAPGAAEEIDRLKKKIDEVFTLDDFKHLADIFEMINNEIEKAKKALEG